MGNDVEQDGDSVKTVDDVRKLMGYVTRLYGMTVATPIVEGALGINDFTGVMRRPGDLSNDERVAACAKLDAALNESVTLAPLAPTESVTISKDFNPPQPRPQVLIAPSHLPEAIARVERLLLAEARRRGDVPDRIFQRDGKLVRLSRNLLAPDVMVDDQYREHNALLIVEVKPKWLANRLDRSIMFVGASAGKPAPGEKRKRVPKNASAELCARMIEDNTQWRHPHLFGTIEAPTLRPDGTALDEPGYDKATGLFFDPGETEFPSIPKNPSREDGLEAIQLIDDLLVDFPFQDAPGYEGVSKAVALAAILTGPVRRTLDIAPAFATTAKEAETGKTELSKLIAGITTGREVSGQPFSDSEEERRKAIGANLRAGRPILFFDNADNVTIEGDFMEKMVTLPSITDRILTTTDEYTAPTNALVLFNGNHISIGGAMTTRVLLIRIVTDTPLAKRRFKYPALFKHVIDNRPELVAAVLTALRAWLLHGERDPQRDTSRFPQWDALIAQALVWYGYADPMRGGDELREVDPVKEAKRDVVRQWAAAFGENAVTASDLHSRTAIRDAIANAKGMHSRDVGPRIVSRYVGTIEDVRLDMDWRAMREQQVKGEAVRWHLQFTGEGDAPAPEIETEATAEDDFGPGGDA